MDFPGPPKTQTIARSFLSSECHELVLLCLSIVYWLFSQNCGQIPKAMFESKGYFRSPFHGRGDTGLLVVGFGPVCSGGV